MKTLSFPVFLRALPVAASLVFAAVGAVAASPASSCCPPYFFLGGNLAPNNDLETPTRGIPAGTTTCWENGGPPSPPSAAAHWLMHSSNAGAKVCSTLVPSTAPGAAAGSRMLKFKAGGNEGSIVQAITLPAGHAYMFSAWVKAASGQVVLLVNATNLGPSSWTSKTGEWEELRVCTNSQGTTDLLQIGNEDPAGGTYFVDRMELREIPVLE